MLRILGCRELFVPVLQNKVRYRFPSLDSVGLKTWFNNHLRL